MTDTAPLSGPRAFQAMSIATALKGYAQHRMQMSAAYTPTAMLRMANALTGKTFKRGQYMEAANALRQMCGQEPYPETAKRA